MIMCYISYPYIFRVLEARAFGQTVSSMAGQAVPGPSVQGLRTSIGPPGHFLIFLVYFWSLDRASGGLSAIVGVFLEVFGCPVACFSPQKHKSIFKYPGPGAGFLAT